MPIPDDDLIAMIEAVWHSVLDSPVAPAPGSPMAAGPFLAATVTISGGWRGRVTLCCSAALARWAAAAMFQSPLAAAGDRELRDAVGELANILAGNVKGLLPASTTLSLPEIACGTTTEGCVPPGVAMQSGREVFGVAVEPAVLAT